MYAFMRPDPVLSTGPVEAHSESDPVPARAPPRTQTFSLPRPFRSPRRVGSVRSCSASALLRASARPRTLLRAYSDSYLPVLVPSGIKTHSEGECIPLYTVYRCRAVYCIPAVYRCRAVYLCKRRGTRRECCIPVYITKTL